MGKKIILIMIIFCLLASCSVPPPWAEKTFLLDSFHCVLQSGEVSLGIQDLFYSFRRIHDTEDLITVMNSGDLIFLKDIEAIPGERTLLYTLGNHRLKVHQTVYAAAKRNGDLFYSLDASTWYPMSNNRKKGITNIRYNYPASSILHMENKKMEISFQWAALIGENPREINMKDRAIVEMKEGMIFLSSDKKENTIDLNEVFLKIPGGTELQYDIQFTGNLINSEYNNFVDRVGIIRDFYIYTSDDSDLKLGISLDGNNWNYSILAFKFDVSGYFSVGNPGQIDFIREINISYSIDE